MFCNAWWPAVSAPTALARLADIELTKRVATPILSDRECELLSASYQGATDWTAADGALLDELVHLLGPLPAPDDQELPVSPILTRDGRRSSPQPTCFPQRREKSTHSSCRTRRTPTSSWTRRRT